MEYGRDELRLGVGIRLAIVSVLRRQSTFQVFLVSGLPVITPQRISERDLVRPSPVTGPDHVQVR